MYICCITVCKYCIILYNCVSLVFPLYNIVEYLYTVYATLHETYIEIIILLNDILLDRYSRMPSSLLELCYFSLLLTPRCHHDDDGSIGSLSDCSLSSLFVANLALGSLVAL